MVFSGYMPSCGIAGLFGSFRGIPGGVVVKNPPANARDIRNLVTHSGILVWGVPGLRKLAGYSPRGCKDSDTTQLIWHACLA